MKIFILLFSIVLNLSFIDLSKDKYIDLNILDKFV